jgi:hypothetical protein
MLDPDEFKERVVEIATDLGSGLTYDEDELCDTWEGLAEEVTAMAKHAAICANRLASYAGIAARKRNLGL